MEKTSSWVLVLAVGMMIGAGAVSGSPLVHVEKRSDDPDPLVAVVNKLSSDMQAVQAQLTALRDQQDLSKVMVGFATSVLHEHTLGNGVVIKFDGVQYNQGNAYNAGTGMFTAPVSGMYTFFIKTEVDPGNTAAMGIIKEGHRELYIYGSDHDSFQTPSGQMVLHVNQGERVWVETVSSTNRIRTWARFGGFLVQRDFS